MSASSDTSADTAAPPSSSSTPATTMAATPPPNLPTPSSSGSKVTDGSVGAGGKPAEAAGIGAAGGGDSPSVDTAKVAQALLEKRVAVLSAMIREVDASTKEIHVKDLKRGVRFALAAVFACAAGETATFHSDTNTWAERFLKTLLTEHLALEERDYMALQPLLTAPAAAAAAATTAAARKKTASTTASTAASTAASTTPSTTASTADIDDDDTENGALATPASPMVRGDTKAGTHMLNKAAPFLETLGSVEQRWKLFLVLMPSLALHHGYDARTRQTFRFVVETIGVPWSKVQSVEDALALQFVQQVLQEAKKKKSANRWRALKIGGAVLAGGVLLAVTGGLAAPGIIGGVGAVAAAGGVTGTAAGALATVAATTYGTVALISLLGLGGGGLAGYRMARRTADLSKFQFTRLSEAPSMHVIICVAGWCSKGADEELVEPWRKDSSGMPYWAQQVPYGEQYALVWEPKELKDLGHALESMAIDTARDVVVGEFLKQTLLATLMAAWTWPSYVLKAVAWIDTPWAVGIARADKGGVLLAQVLKDRKYHGDRPVTLVGYSMGARLIFRCLEALVEMGDAGAGIVQDVVLMGAPVTSSRATWSKLRRVVSGRLVNVFCSKDWILKYVYRAQSMTYGVAGLQAIGVPKKERMSVAKARADSTQAQAGAAATEVAPTSVAGGAPAADDVASVGASVGESTTNTAGNGDDDGGAAAGSGGDGDGDGGAETPPSAASPGDTGAPDDDIPALGGESDATGGDDHVAAETNVATAGGGAGGGAGAGAGAGLDAAEDGAEDDDTAEAATVDDSRFRLPFVWTGAGVENFDVSDIVKGHTAYPRCIPQILARIQLEGDVRYI